MSGTQAVTPAPVQLPKEPVYTGKKGKGVNDPTHKAPFWVKLVVVLACLGWFIPTLGLAITSFRDQDDATRSGWWTIFTSPSNFTRLTLENYGDLFQRTDLGTAFVNSLAITLPATIIPILIAAFAAYAFTFMDFPGRNFLFLAVVSLLVVPNYIAFVPILRVYTDFELGGTFPAVWLAHIGFGMSLAIYILRNHMATLPRSVIESAKIDGATHYQTFFRLVLPMSVPALAAFAIFQFLWVWNDLLVALVFIGPGDNAPITVAVRNNLMGQAGAGQNLVTAGGFLTMVLPIIVFLAMQRYFVRGLTAGAVKG
jgi:alpha-glucoside transport system permease protein